MDNNDCYIILHICEMFVIIYVNLVFAMKVYKQRLQQFVRWRIVNGLGQGTLKLFKRELTRFNQKYMYIYI